MISCLRKLKSEDGQLFEVEENILCVSQYLKDLIDFYPDPDSEININQVDGKNLSKIIFCLRIIKQIIWIKSRIMKCQISYDIPYP